MIGTIRCARCGKSRDSYICACGAHKVYVKLYWKGKTYQYRTDQHGVHMGFYEGERFLTVLRAKIDAHTRGRETFNPLDYLTAAINELRLGIVADRWLDEIEEKVKKGDLSQGTLDSYRSRRRTWFSKIQDMDIRSVDVHVLKDFGKQLTGKIKNRKNILIDLQTMLTWARGEGIIQTLPAFPKIEGKDTQPKKAITVQSQDEYLEKIPERHRDLYRFAFDTGLREGELAALKVKDIDGDTLTVQRTYTSGNIIHEKTKGKDPGKESVPLSDLAIEIARKQSAGKLPEAFLFINPATGRGYLPYYIYKVWKATGAPVTFHEAGRHSFCTQIARSGAHPEQMRRLMRHSDIQTTMKYTHMDITDLREIVNRRGEVLRFEPSLKQKKIS